MSILGMWMWAQNVRAYGAEHVLSWCQKARVTDLFFLTKGLSGVTAFRSALAPCEEKDLLREVTECAHQKGMRVHAWFTSACDEHYKALHPESGRCHLVRGRDKEFISLADEGYLRYMEDITRDLFRRYDVDGLHLDYIRYNHLLYGWGEEDLARYAQAGADIGHLKKLMQRTFLDEDKDECCIFDALRSGDASVRALADCRRQDVVRFARRITAAARAENSRLTLSAALMPEGAYDDTTFADLHYGQCYRDAAMLYDLALPMAYSQAYEKSPSWMAEVARGTLRHGLKTVMGLHAYEGGTGQQLLSDIAALQGLPIEGTCLFREGATALAFDEGHTFTLYNALNTPITRVADEESSAAVCILPGQAAHVPLKGSVLRAFTGEKEISVYLTR